MSLILDEDRAICPPLAPVTEADRLREQVRDLNSLAEKQAKLIGEMRAKLREIDGDNATPQNGCQIASIPLDMSSVLVEFEYEPAERETQDDPALPAVIEPLNILINGKWLAISDLLWALDEDRLRDAIREAGKAAEQARKDYV